LDAAPNLYDRRLIFFTGKGGVGKTTVASAFALSCAQRGEKTLLVEINTRDKVSRMFGSSEIGTDIIEVEDNLYAVDVTPEAAMEEYAMMMLRVRIVYKAVFENRIVRAFLRAIPGLNELVMLGKAYFHAIEEEGDGHRWDKVVVDAPATGHGIFFLQIPSVITSILSSGHMYDEAKKMLDVLGDGEVTALNFVTLPEEMPVNETLMLHQTAVEQLDLPLGWVVINGIYPEVFDADEAETVERLHAAEPGEPLGGLVDAASFRIERTRIQKRYMQELADALPLPRARLPFIFTERLDFPAVRSMAERLAEQFGGEEGA